METEINRISKIIGDMLDKEFSNILMPTSSVIDYNSSFTFDDLKKIMQNVKVFDSYPIEIIRSEHLPSLEEDWSNVRSPSRAKRRLKRGYKQNIKYVTIEKGYMIGEKFFTNSLLYENMVVAFS